MSNLGVSAATTPYAVARSTTGSSSSTPVSNTSSTTPKMVSSSTTPSVIGVNAAKISEESTNVEENIKMFYLLLKKLHRLCMKIY